MPTPVRLQHADGRTVEMWLEDDHLQCARILINRKWFRATNDATPTYKEERRTDEPAGCPDPRD